MPFTAFHLGPALPIKSLQPKKISLLVFGWAQVLTDLQPLVYILTHRGHLHGVSHSFFGCPADRSGGSPQRANGHKRFEPAVGKKEGTHRPDGFIGYGATQWMAGNV